MKVIIVGGGIMGCATAYYLSKLHEEKSPEEKEKDPLEIVIVERVAVACAASGKAGGFLAKTWCTGEMAKIASASFDMYQELADAFGASQLKYRRISAFSGQVLRSMAERKEMNPGCNLNNPHSKASSVNQQGRSRDVFNNVFDRNKLVPGQLIGTEQTTAQVTPWFVTNTFFKASGATLVIGDLIGVLQEGRKLTGIRILKRDKETGAETEEEIFGDKICFCLGVWTNVVKALGLKVPKAMGRKVHSVVLKARPALIEKLSYLKMAIFTDFNNTEIIIREGGVVYVNGSERAFMRVKEKSGEIPTDEKACDKIIKFWKVMTQNAGITPMQTVSSFAEVAPVSRTESTAESAISGDVLNESATQVLFKQTCHLPLVDHEYNGEQLPAMSKIPDLENGFVCAGHTCWGILLGPISGKIMAHLIMNNDPHRVIDTTPFMLN